MANHVLLSSAEHKDLRVHNRYSPQLGDNVMFSPTFSHEFKTIQSHYPILFQKQEGEANFVAVALFGLENNENQFLTENGWDASYIPLMMQRLPFSIGLYSDHFSSEKKRVLHIDLDHPKVTSDQSGQRLFNEDGSVSDHLEHMSGVLDAIHQSQADDRQFVKKLTELELLEPANIDVRLANGAEGQLVGFFTINEQKLAALGPERLSELHKNGWLEAIYMTIASLAKIQNLVDRKSKRVLKR